MSRGAKISSLGIRVSPFGYLVKGAGTCRSELASCTPKPTIEGPFPITTENPPGPFTTVLPNMSVPPMPGIYGVW